MKVREGYVKGNVKVETQESQKPQSVKVREGYVKRNMKQICTSMMLFLVGFSV